MEVSPMESPLESARQQIPWREGCDCHSDSTMQCNFVPHTTMSSQCIPYRRAGLPGLLSCPVLGSDTTVLQHTTAVSHLNQSQTRGCIACTCIQPSAKAGISSPSRPSRSSTTGLCST
jgi:hypothetical protein